jgi:hypothetical protein
LKIASCTLWKDLLQLKLNDKCYRIKTYLPYLFDAPLNWKINLMVSRKLRAKCEDQNKQNNDIGSQPPFQINSAAYVHVHVPGGGGNEPLFWKFCLLRIGHTNALPYTNVLHEIRNTLPQRLIALLLAQVLKLLNYTQNILKESQETGDNQISDRRLRSKTLCWPWKTSPHIQKARNIRN